MRAGLTAVFILLLGVMVSGCGQKGPLYREAPAGEDTRETTVSESEKDRPR